MNAKNSQWAGMVVRDANNYSYIHIYIVNTYNWINRQSTYNIDLYIFISLLTNKQTIKLSGQNILIYLTRSHSVQYFPLK